MGRLAAGGNGGSVGGSDGGGFQSLIVFNIHGLKPDRSCAFLKRLAVIGRQL